MDNYFENYLFHLPITKRAAVYCLLSRLWIVAFLLMERRYFLIIEEPSIVIKHVFFFAFLLCLLFGLYIVFIISQNLEFFIEFVFNEITFVNLSGFPVLEVTFLVLTK